MILRIKREIKLALTILVAVLILIWGINFLKARALFDRNNVFYGVYERVDGLKVSSSVIYRGYSVGQVNEISFIGERFDKVLVQFTVGKDLEIASNSIAAIRSADLMGSKAIDLIPGDAMTLAQSGDTLRTQLELGIMEQLNKHLEPLKQKAENIMVSLDTVLLALQNIFSESEQGNIQSSLQGVSRTLNNIEAASGTLNQLINKESVQISHILKNINNITSNLEASNQDVSKSLNNISAISDSLKAINLNRSIRYLNNVLQQVDTVMMKINYGKGTLGQVVNDSELYYNLAALSENLNKLLTEFREHPKRFVNLSVFSLGSGKKKGEEDYSIAVAVSEKSLPLNADVFVKFPDLKEYRKGELFYYLLNSYKNLNQAEKDLEQMKKTYPAAFIVKIE